jgi:D-amino-acid dehydrogenase
VPLASPGLVKKAIKWMFDSSSPFYMKPRLDIDFMRWGIKFLKNANQKTLLKNSIHLNEILQYSKVKTVEIAEELKNTFDLELKGCYMMCRNESTLHHEIELCERAKEFGIDTIVYTKEDLEKLEPKLGVQSIGAVYFPIDAHLHPIKWVKSMREYLSNKGVKIYYNTEVTDFKIENGRVKTVVTKDEAINADKVVIATGAWLPNVVKKLGVNILLQAGKGYSTTYENVNNNLSRPAILVDDRVALTPLGNDLRIGGTMELTGINHTIHLNRMQAIVNACNKNFTNINLTMPPKEKIWCGLRPVTTDGLPFIGRVNKYENLVLAGGHAMLGISLAAGTGKLVTDILEGKKTDINIDGFRVER